MAALTIGDIVNIETSQKDNLPRVYKCRIEEGHRGNEHDLEYDLRNLFEPNNKRKPVIVDLTGVSFKETYLAGIILKYCTFRSSYVGVVTDSPMQAKILNMLSFGDNIRGRLSIHSSVDAAIKAYELNYD